MTAVWYALNRYDDVGGVSGLGVVAWCLVLDHGVLMLWDTTVDGKPTDTVEWLPTLDHVRLIHGHDGRTVPLRVATQHAERGRALLHGVIGDVMSTLANLVEEVT